MIYIIFEINLIGIYIYKIYSQEFITFIKNIYNESKVINYFRKNLKEEFLKNNLLKDY